MKNTVVIAFGERLTRMIEDKDEIKKVVTGEGDFVTRHFKTKAELEAYMLGLEDQDGWFNFRPLTEKEVGIYNHLIHR